MTRPATLAFLVLVLAGGGACVDVDGGAVELFWDIRTTEGEPSACETEDFRLGTVSLECRAPDGTPCTSRIGRHSWPCADRSGATPFDVPPGRWELGIRVACRGGTPAQVRVPDPIVRDVMAGDLVSLNALLIVVDSQVPPCPGAS